MYSFHYFPKTILYIEYVYEGLTKCFKYSFPYLSICCLLRPEKCGVEMEDGW